VFLCLSNPFHVLVVILRFSDDSTNYAAIASSNCDVDYKVYSNIDASANSSVQGRTYTDEEIACSDAEEEIACSANHARRQQGKSARCHQGLVQMGGEPTT
jgi:hypothetical protein